MYNPLMKKAGVAHEIDFTIGAEAANVIRVSGQIKDYNGADLAVKSALIAYLSSDSGGNALEASSATLSSAAGTDGALSELALDNTFLIISENDGDFDIDVTQTSGADTHYLNVVMPDGRVVTSGALTFAA